MLLSIPINQIAAKIEISRPPPVASFVPWLLSQTNAMDREWLSEIFQWSNSSIDWPIESYVNWLILFPVGIPWIYMVLLFDPFGLFFFFRIALHISSQMMMSFGVNGMILGLKRKLKRLFIY